MCALQRNQQPDTCRGASLATSVNSNIASELLFSNNFLSVYSFSVRAKEWKLLPSCIRMADVTIKAINPEVQQTGQVMVFLGAAEKYVKLPFKYYQLRKILSIRASYTLQKVVVKISGKFILNVNSSFNFRVVVLSDKVPRAYRQFNWTNFENIRTRFNIKTADKT